MIKIDNKDSIIDIIVKINHSKDNEIILDFPFWHPILHNYTSLKILKNNTENKELIIITSDITAKKLGSKLWIKYSLTKNTDLLKYNYTFLEYFKFTLKKYKQEFLELIFGTKKQNSFENKQKAPWKTYPWSKKDYAWKNNNTNKKSMIWFFLVWLIISILLFIFIFYFAVNKTYIYISPEVIIKSRAKNIYFKNIENDEIVVEENVIKLKKITKTINLTETFWTSWISEKNIKKATGDVVFSNKLYEIVKLLPHTRLQTSDWILYETNDSVIIPSATKSSSGTIIPWEVKSKITSKLYDINWIFTWKNVNINSSVLLTLPWLKDNKDEIYATTKTKISGWEDNYIKTIWVNDITNAKNILETKLQLVWLTELKKQIAEENKKNNITYDILNVDNIIKYSDLEIKWDEELKIWENKDNFVLTWSIVVTSFIYNKDLVLSKLQNTIKESMLGSIEKLLFINKDSFRIVDILSKEDEPLSIKATTQVEVYISHNFLYDADNYIYKLRNVVAWLKKEDAMSLLLNNQKISNVKIETRPFFMKNISSLPSNIIFKIVEK